MGVGVVGEGTGVGGFAIVLFSESGRGPRRQIAYSPLFSFVFCKATGASTQPVPPLGVKAGDRGSNTPLDCRELGGLHAVHSVLHRGFAECGTWLDLCVCVGNQRNSHGPPGVLGPRREADK